MNEADLVKIRTVLEKETLVEACQTMERVLLELGYHQARTMPSRPALDTRQEAE